MASKGASRKAASEFPWSRAWPGKIKAGSESDHISAFWDVMPTIAELTGTKAPADIDGVSFAPHAASARPRSRRSPNTFTGSSPPTEVSRRSEKANGKPCGRTC